MLVIIEMRYILIPGSINCVGFDYFIKFFKRVWWDHESVASMTSIVAIFYVVTCLDTWAQHVSQRDMGCISNSRQVDIYTVVFIYHIRYYITH
jgi:hypothetical protein